MLTHFRAVYGRYEPGVKPYRCNEIFSQPVSDTHYLVTTRQRAWVLLTRDEYVALLQRRVHEDEALYALLEDLGVILTERNLEDVARLYAHRYSFLYRSPGLFIMVPTNRCNMACRYCHAEAGTAGDHSLDMTEETAYKAVDFFLTVPSVHERKHLTIEFQGGECLLRWDLVRKTMNYASARCKELGYSCAFNMVTNLVGMTDEIASELHERKNVRVCSSLDGPQAVNDQQRVFHNSAGTYDRHRVWVDRLQNEYDCSVGCLPTLTKNNLGYETELVDEYRRMGQKSIYLRYVSEVGRAHSTSPELGLSAAEYLAIWNKCLDYILSLHAQGEALQERKTAELLGNMLNPRFSYMCMRRPCGLGLHQVVVDQQGNICGCDQTRSNPMYHLGNVHTDTYESCFTSETARSMRSLVPEAHPRCQACAFSPYCGYCVARGSRQHNSPLQKTPEDFECQVYSGMLFQMFRRLSDDAYAAVLNRWV